MERVVLNALANMRLAAAFAPPAKIFGIVFRHGKASIEAVTDAKQRSGIPRDPPLHYFTFIAG